MDREEARELLLGYSRFINEETDLWEALDLAIEALGQKSYFHCPKCGTIVRDGRQYHDLVYRGEAEKHQLSGETSTISEETSTCKLKKDHDFLIREGEKVSKEQKSGLDLISRQQAVEALMAHFIPQTYTGEQVEQAEKLAQKIMNKVPPVTPTERTTETMIVDGEEIEIDPVSYEIGYTHGQTAPIGRTGEWIPVRKVYRTSEADFPNTHIEWETATDPDDIDAVRCSECGEVFDFDAARNWCTHCGAKMKGGTENE